jgi:hypothetical protein
VTPEINNSCIHASDTQVGTRVLRAHAQVLSDKCVSASLPVETILSLDDELAMRMSAFGTLQSLLHVAEGKPGISKEDLRTSGRCERLRVRA